MKTPLLNRPHLIVMVGVPGSGKSFFAEHFADTFKAPIVGYDQLRNEILNNSSDGKAEEKVVSKVIFHMLGEILKTERTVVFDGPIFTTKSAEIINSITKKFGYEPLYVWVQIDQITAIKRSSKHVAGKPTMGSEKFNDEIKKFNPPKSTKNIIVISGKHTYASQLKIVLKYLAEPI